MSNVFISPALYDALGFIAKQAYDDAVAHGLYNTADLNRAKHSPTYIRQRLALLIREEVCEAWDAAQDHAHYAEELADVVIMAMSAAGHLGIDLAAEVKRKMEINKGRPYMHGGKVC